MEIIMRKVGELVPYEQNTKKHDEKQINNVANSIKRFGWQQPLVIDENSVVVIGHCRLLAAKKLGIKEVPCTVASGLSEAEIRELRIADNKTNESPWDLDMLEVELPDLDFDGFDFDLPKLNGDWFETRERYEENDGADEEYNAFLDKFELKKTTDDCYTPDNVYDAVANWVAEEYKINRDSFVRPFYPGGDYQSENYSAGCFVVDNPPFSIMAEIVRFYCQNKISFFLFAPALTLFTAADQDVSYLAVGCDVVYENGAKVKTSFITNLDTCKLRTAPSLYQAVKAANDENLRALHRELPKYTYPNHVVTAAAVQRWGQYGVEYVLDKEECERISFLDAQKEEDKAIFGGGFLTSDSAAAKKTEAEKEADERAVVERAAAERAAAEKAAATQWTLSSREMEIVARLNDAGKNVMRSG